MSLPRFRIRTLLVAVALVAFALVGARIYQEGFETHWLLLKLRYGSAEARRSAALRARDMEFRETFRGLVAVAIGHPPSPATAAARDRHQHLRAQVLLPALSRVVNDPDAGCRAAALSALGVLATFHASGLAQDAALQQVLMALRDRDELVRVAAVGAAGSLARRDANTALDALRSALSDPSVEVRQAAAAELGFVAVMVPEIQSDVAGILMPLLASREDTRIRTKAVWGLCYFGADGRRNPAGTCPDVVPALLGALCDPAVEVRRTAAMVLGSTTTHRVRWRISSWDQRKTTIIPALQTALADDDTTVCEEAALALFSLGERDPAVVTLIEQGARNAVRSRKPAFESALQQRQNEREASDAVELSDSEDGTS